MKIDAALATASNGYHFAGWSGDVTGLDTNANPVTVTMDRKRALTGNFAINLYGIAATAGANGAIAPSALPTLNDFLFPLNQAMQRPLVLRSYFGGHEVFRIDNLRQTGADGLNFLVQLARQVQPATNLLANASFEQGQQVVDLGHIVARHHGDVGAAPHLHRHQSFDGQYLECFAQWGALDLHRHGYVFGIKIHFDRSHTQNKSNVNQ